MVRFTEITIHNSKDNTLEKFKDNFLNNAIKNQRRLYPAVQQIATEEIIQLTDLELTFPECGKIEIKKVEREGFFFE